MTQREAFYDALVPVINGASTSVNFGFLTYNPNNQGAVLGYHMNNFGEDPSALIAALPTVDSDSDGELWSNAPRSLIPGRTGLNPRRCMMPVTIS